jgi:hypothetical protein
MGTNQNYKIIIMIEKIAKNKLRKGKSRNYLKAKSIIIVKIKNLVFLVQLF